MNEVALRANDVLRNDVMLRINDVALRANGFSPSSLEKHRKLRYNKIRKAVELCTIFYTIFYRIKKAARFSPYLVYGISSILL